jgi:hypothetical protein
MNTENSRLQDPAIAYSLWTTLKDADVKSSEARAKVDAMVNGEQPFDQEVLDATGQGDAANFNTREAASLISQECSAYYDLITSKLLVGASCNTGDMRVKKRKSQTIQAEFTKLIRKWDGWEFWYTNLVRQFVTHGLGVAFHQDETDMRFRSCGWADFKLPRDTPATEESIEVSACLYPRELAFLLDMVKASEALPEAERCWNVKRLKEIIKDGFKSVLGDNDTTNLENWEYIERAVKENGVYFGTASSKKIWLINFWIREEDGTFTHAILQKDDSVPGSDTSPSWLYFNRGRFSSLNDAFTVFCYDINATTYHQARGRGYVIQPQVLSNNMLACRMSDGAMAATQNLLQVVNPSQTELSRMATASFGNNEILPAGVKYIDRKPIDYTNSVLPVIAYLQEQLRKNNTGARPQIPALDKNVPTLHAQLEAQNNASLSSAALDRFYTQLDKLYASMFRRAICKDYLETDPFGKEVAAFRKALAAKGVTQKDLEDTAIKAWRMVGAGSAANRLQAYERLERRMGAFDPEGRRALVYDIVAEEVGPENADRYIQPELLEEQRQPVDVKLADLENYLFKVGEPIEVIPNEDHFSHVARHLPSLLSLMDNLEQLGENAQLEQLIQTYQILMTGLPHISQHINIMAADKARITETKGAIEIAQQLSAASDRLRNQITRLQKAQEAQQQKQMQEEQDKMAAYVRDLEEKASQPGGDAKAQAELMKAQVKSQIMEMEFKQRLAHREAEFNLNKALKDAEVAAKLLREAKLEASKSEKKQEEV